MQGKFLFKCAALALAVGLLVGGIIKQARAMDINCAIVGGDGWDSPKLPEIASVRALNNTYFTNHFSPDAESPEAKSFVVNYLKEYKQKPLACAVFYSEKDGSCDPAYGSHPVVHEYLQ